VAHSGRDRFTQFLANCRAAGFDEKQCLFLHAVELRKAANDDAITAATMR
jgi:hypothetical protein